MGQNATHNANSTNTTSSPRGPTPQSIPMFRQGQPRDAIYAELSSVAVLSFFVILLNTMLIVVIQRKLKSIPYLMIQNIAVADLMISLLNGPTLCFGVLLDPFGLAFQSVCNIQGFLHNWFCLVFLCTVSLIAVTRAMLVRYPELYAKLFQNKLVFRLLMVGLWAVSGLLATPPINTGILGSYKRMEATCWLAWEPDKIADMVYNVLIGLLPLVGALTFVVLAFGAIKMNAVAPAQREPPIAAKSFSVGIDLPVCAKPNPLPTPKVAIVPMNTAVLKIAAAQLAVYIILWVPFTVIAALFQENKLLFDVATGFTFVFLFFARGLFNPIMVFVFSGNVASEGYKLYFKCNWQAGEIPGTA
ncbi:parapinopsin [Nematostella vectensis]|uniref:parapinopsin n=1 Tax=Nematostella vectensis TaxID=45351 RepID=UPI00207753A4|nr:parapinopsin [Nematostella vectensis]XP_032230513.2 parapinopsin [Nematostella vectensis]